MYIRGVDSRSTKWFSAAWVHGDIGTTDGFENAPCVGSGVLQRGIAMDGRDAQEFQGWMVSSDEYGKCILVRY